MAISNQEVQELLIQLPLRTHIRECPLRNDIEKREVGGSVFESGSLSEKTCQMIPMVVWAFTYNSSTRYGAALKETFKATFTEGAACAQSVHNSVEDRKIRHSLHGKVENLMV